MAAYSNTYPEQLGALQHYPLINNLDHKGVKGVRNGIEELYSLTINLEHLADQFPLQFLWKFLDHCREFTRFQESLLVPEVLVDSLHPILQLKGDFFELQISINCKDLVEVLEPDDVGGGHQDHNQFLDDVGEDHS